MWLEALADDEFGAASANIDDQPGFDVVGQGVGNPEVDQAGLLATVYHIHPGAEDTAGRDRELVPVAGHPQGIGTHHPHPLGFDARQQLGEAAEAFQAPFDSLRGQSLILQAGAQLDFFRQCLDRTHFAVLDFGNDQVKGIAAEIDGRQQGALGQGFRGGIFRQLGFVSHAGREAPW